MKKWLLIVVLFLFSCKQDIVTIVFVKDGDTFVTSKGEEIRLAEVDAPEVEHRGMPAQEYGEEAKEFAINTLLKKEVGIIRTGKTSYGRTIATVYTLDGTNFAELLVKNGLAHITPWTRNNTLVDEYYEAKRNNIGLFKYPYEYPYIYRRKYKIK